jgi:hypothetical protein
MMSRPAAAGLAQGEFDLPLARLGRAAADDGEIYLLRLAPGEGLRQKRGGGLGAGGDNHAGSLAVEPMHQPRALAVRFGERRQQIFQAAGNAGPALHRKAGGLVEDKNLRVFVDE